MVKRKRSLRYKNNTLVLASLWWADAVGVKTSFRKPRPPPSCLATGEGGFQVNERHAARPYLLAW